MLEALAGHVVELPLTVAEEETHDKRQERLLGILHNERATTNTAKNMSRDVNLLVVQSSRSVVLCVTVHKWVTSEPCGRIGPRVLPFFLASLGPEGFLCRAKLYFPFVYSDQITEHHPSTAPTDSTSYTRTTSGSFVLTDS